MLKEDNPFLIYFVAHFHQKRSASEFNISNLVDASSTPPPPPPKKKSDKENPSQDMKIEIERIRKAEQNLPTR